MIKNGLLLSENWCPTFYENRPKGPETVWRVVNSLKTKYKWPKLGL